MPMCCPPWASRPASMADASAILSELPGLQVIDRTTMNAFEDRASVSRQQDRAQAADLRWTPHRDLPHVRNRPGAERRLRAMFVTDAVGGRSKRRTARRSNGCHMRAPSRIRARVLCELFRD